MPNVMPYNFVPLEKNGKKKVAPIDPYRAIGRDGSPRLSGYMRCCLTTVTPLFIPNTTGDTYCIPDPDGKTRRTRVFYSRETLTQKPNISNNPKKPIIPGSSIRGVLRSVFEAASNSCLRVDSDAVEDKYKPCTGGKRDTDSSRDLCPACSLFGMILVKDKRSRDDNPIRYVRSFAGRLRISDALASEKTKVEYQSYTIPGQYKPRQFMCIDNQTCQLKGRKFYWHHNPSPKPNWNVDTIYAIKPNVSFCFNIYFDCLKEEELMQLAAVVRLDGIGMHKLGAAKPLGFGSVKMEIEKIKIRSLDITLDKHGISYKNEEDEKATNRYKNTTMQKAFGSKDNHLDDLMSILRFDAVSSPKGEYSLNAQYPPTEVGHNPGNKEPFIKGSISEIVAHVEEERRKVKENMRELTDEEWEKEREKHSKKRGK